MDLRLFFNGFTNENIANYKNAMCIGEKVDFFTSTIPDLKDVDIALFTIGEGENEKTGELEAYNDSMDENTYYYNQLRSAFYALQEFDKPLRIVDLGTLRAGKDLTETRGRLTAVSAYLMQKEVLPLFVANTHELDMGQFLAYQELEKLVSVLVVDSKIDMDLTKDSSQGHIQEMLLHHPNCLFDYCHLGYQRYLVHKQLLDTFIKLNFEMKSVGQMRDNLQEIEPLLRGADMLSFDLSALRNSDLPLKNGLNPFGLTGEEACQVSWYAGTNEKLTSVGFYGLSEENQQDLLVSQTVATLIWYFIEGFAHRKIEYSFKSNFHIKYIVPLIDSDKNLPTHELIFYKSKQSDKWWMEVPTELGQPKVINRNAIVPCSYADYQTACHGGIPDRWLKAFNKLN